MLTGMRLNQFIKQLQDLYFMSTSICGKFPSHAPEPGISLVFLTPLPRILIPPEHSCEIHTEEVVSSYQETPHLQSEQVKATPHPEKLTPKPMLYANPLS